MIFLFFRKSFLLFLSILLLFIIYLLQEHKDQIPLQSYYINHVETEGNNQKQKSTYRRNSFSEKISLDTIERKVGLQIKRKLPLNKFKEKSIIALGDSLIEGIGPTDFRGGFISILEGTINEKDRIASFQNYGKLGERTEDLIQRLKEDPVPSEIKKSDILILAIGSNDLLQIVKDNFTELSMETFLKEQTNFKKKLKSILQRIERLNPNIDIYIVGLYNPLKRLFGEIPELEEILKAWNKSIENMAMDLEGGHFIAIDDLFGEEEGLFAEDQFHPSERGYRKIAERILDYLLKGGG